MLHTDAMVLATRPYREHDELVSLFTKDFGKRTLLAKGTKKPLSKLAPFLHIPTVVSCSFVEGRHHDILTNIDVTSASVPSTYLALSESKGLAPYRAAEAFFEVCHALLYEGQHDEDLWDLLEAILAQGKEYGHIGGFSEQVYDEWLWKLVATLGMCPDLPSARKTRTQLRDIMNVYCPIQPFLNL